MTKKILTLLLVLTILTACSNPMITLVKVGSSNPSEGCSFVVFYYEQEFISQCYSDYWAAPNPSYGRGYFFSVNAFRHQVEFVYSYPFYFNINIRR